MELTGLIIAAGVAVVAIALFSYTPNDPSFNNATSVEPANPFGTVGAIAADLLIQGFGLAGYLPLIGFGVWSMRLIAKRPVVAPFWRTISLIIAAVAAGVTLSSFPNLSNWPLFNGMGGGFGALVFERGTAALIAVGFSYAELHLSLTATIVAFILWVFGVGMSWKEWGMLAHYIGYGASTLKVSVNKIRTLASSGSVVIEKSAPLIGRLASGNYIDKDDISNGTCLGVNVQFGNIEPQNNVKEQRHARSGLVAPVKPKLKAGRKSMAARQGNLDLEPGKKYVPPPHNLLEVPIASAKSIAHNKETLEQNAKFLGTVLEDFGVKGEIVKVRPGPVVTLYELEPAPGTKTSRVIGLSDDIARSMSAVSVRVAVVPGQNVIGIELPNIRREIVMLRELLSSQDFENINSALPLAVGKDIGGEPVNADLSRMPHLLIAGTTGSGKSVAMNTMILSLLYSRPPEECRLIMIDPKMLELSVYEGIPHLLTPVVTDPNKAIIALKWAVREMEDRYRAMSQLGVRNIASYNLRLAEAAKQKEDLKRQVQTGFDEKGNPVFEEQLLPTDPLPFIVVVVDEMADLMLVAGKEVEAAIQRLAQMARAAGIHLIMATQRPSVDVITGTIKANFPTRISFQVTSKIDSRTILGEQGAEQLLGQGDMLYMSGGGRITRVHGPFVSDNEVEKIVKHLKRQGKPQYIEDITTADEQAFPPKASNSDSLYDEAVAIVAREGKASTSFIQRHLQIGYNRAARIIEQMEKSGIVSPANRVGRREVLIGNN
ncbi:MAG: cell division protein FtsK [Magnetovibrio sp.]|nr:cell division protein FtsK [Magnetovibrio sp.]